MCEEAKKLMNAYLDGEITDAQNKKLNLHLENCESCMIEFEELKFMKELLNEEEMVPIPEHFDAKLHKKLVMASAEIKASGRQKEPHLNKPVNLLNRIKNTRFSVKAAISVAAVFLVAYMAYSNGLFGGYNSYESASTSMDTASMGATEMAVSEPSMYASDKAADDGSYFGSDSAEEYDMGNAGVMDESTEIQTTVSSNTDSTYREGRLIIKSANLSISVEDYDTVISEIKQMLAGTEGFVQSEQMSYRTYYQDQENLKYGSLIIRVPNGMFDNFLETIKTKGEVNYNNAYAEDVTKNYRDTAAEIENLKITEERLQAILENAEKMSDILAIENELTRIRSQINNYTNQLKNWEDLSDLSYVYLEVVEVESLTPQIEKIDDSIFAKAREGFIETLNNIINLLEAIFVWIVSKSLIIVVVGGLGLIVFRKFRKA